MRNSAAAIAMTFLVSTPVVAQRPGDVVAVVMPADIRSGERIVGQVEPGNTLVVVEATADSLRVNFKELGWIARAAAVPLTEAVAYFTRQIETDSQNAAAYFGRACAYKAQDKWRPALEDLNRAVELAPAHASYRLMRAYVAARTGDRERALADYDAVLAADPIDVQAYRLRAGLRVERGEYAAAIDDYNRAVRLAPNDAALNNDRAWLAATCPDERFRNGEQAVRDATVACELCSYGVFNRLATLAAAHAEAGNFDEAVQWQQQALALSPPTYRQAQQARLRLFQAGKPYREQPGVWK